MTNKPQLITLGLFTTITDDGQKTGLLDLSPLLCALKVSIIGKIRHFSDQR